MFNVTVAAKFSMHAKIKYMELYLIDLLSLGLMYVKKNQQFLRSTGTKMHTKENWFRFSASRCMLNSASFDRTADLPRPDQLQYNLRFGESL